MPQIYVEIARSSLPYVLTPDGMFRLSNPLAWCPGRLLLVEYQPSDQYATITAVCLFRPADPGPFPQEIP